ncbi:hypothetical protein ACFQ6N_04630 [Kitasatospora sp. NPDC056446]|uniref:hypothetical protein n=1 Tax=Kitasatospora sp. NPDC056446 TaxID=3345819 RepID=UPI00367C96FB
MQVGRIRVLLAAATAVLALGVPVGVATAATATAPTGAATGGPAPQAAFRAVPAGPHILDIQWG